MPGMNDFLLDSTLQLPSLLAQTGFAKTMLGYVATGVLIVLALAMICRPSHRPDDFLKNLKKKK
jgi:hypothetical protein